MKRKYPSTPTFIAWLKTGKHDSLGSSFATGSTLSLARRDACRHLPGIIERTEGRRGQCPITVTITAGFAQNVIESWEAQTLLDYMREETT